MSSYNARLVTCAIVVFLSTFLMVTIFGAHTDPWWKWFYNFQTMLAAILAILAAYLTILETRRAESLAQLRHRENLDEQRRADVQRLARAELPASRHLLAWGQRCIGILEAYEREMQADEILSTRTIILIRSAAEELAYLIRSEPIADAADLFNPAMALRYRSLRSIANLLHERLDRLMTGPTANLLLTPDAPPPAELVRAIISMAQHVRSACDIAVLFANDLRSANESFARRN